MTEFSVEEFSTVCNDHCFGGLYDGSSVMSVLLSVVI